MAVLRDLYSSENKKHSDTEENNNKKEQGGMGFIVFGLIILALWSSLVFSGQKRLTQTFLPEITHSTEEKAIKDASQ